MKKNIQLLGTTFITVLILLVSMLPLTACSSSQQYTYKSMDMNAILQKVGTKTVKNKSVVCYKPLSMTMVLPYTSLNWITVQHKRNTHRTIFMKPKKII